MSKRKHVAKLEPREPKPPLWSQYSEAMRVAVERMNRPINVNAATRRQERRRSYNAVWMNDGQAEPMPR